MHYSNLDSRSPRREVVSRRRPVAPKPASSSRPKSRAGAALPIRLATGAAALFLAIAPVAAQTTLTVPTLDKWVYPFASNGGGTRTSAPVFGAIGTPGIFDDRDGQFLIGFSLSGTVPSGLGAANYAVTSVRLTLTMSFNAADLVVWDGTYDPINTYNPANGAAINGDDPGRSIELYGVGYRGGFTALSMLENSAYGFGDPSAEGIRNFYATDMAGGVARDVSNNIRDAFDTVPFAIGQVAPAHLNSDGTIRDAAPITFDLNLANPNVLSYVQNAFHTGRLNLIASSLHVAQQGGPATRPEFDTKELGVIGTPAQLQFRVAVVPEPSALGLVGMGALLLSARRRSKKEVRA